MSNIINSGKFVCIDCAKQIVEERAKRRTDIYKHFEFTCEHEFAHVELALEQRYRITSMRIVDMFLVFDKNNHASIWTVDKLIQVNDDLKGRKSEELEELLSKKWFERPTSGQAFFVVDDALKGSELGDVLIHILNAKDTYDNRIPNRPWCNKVNRWMSSDAEQVSKIKRYQKRLEKGKKVDVENNAITELKQRLNDVANRSSSVEDKIGKSHIQVIETVEKHLNIDLKP